MGVQDRDWYHEAQRERERKALLFPEPISGHL
jgi:hypothetical protein